ncbi:hypothetical protein P7L70_02185 (plasmid) [Tistrella mobilis]|uniref:hypothetical protein n=1 Tax=Tistrella mobilis TaxID=171437 RepID=UPI003555C512
MSGSPSPDSDRRIIVDHVNHTAGLVAADLRATAPVAAGLPLANMLDAWPARVARLNAAAFSIDIDLGAEKPVGVLALARTSLGPGDMVAWSAGTLRGGNDLWQGPAVTGARTGIGFHMALAPAGLVARHLRVTVTTAPASQHVDIGLIWIGPGDRPEANMAYGWRLEMEDASRIAVAEASGAEWVDRGPKRRSLVFDFSMTASDRQAAIDRLFDRGLTRPVLCVPAPLGDWPREGMIGRIAAHGGFVRTDPLFHSTSLTIRELL